MSASASLFLNAATLHIYKNGKLGNDAKSLFSLFYVADAKLERKDRPLIEEEKIFPGNFDRSVFRGPIKIG